MPPVRVLIFATVQYFAKVRCEVDPRPVECVGCKAVVEALRYDLHGAVRRGPVTDEG